MSNHYYLKVNFLGTELRIVYILNNRNKCTYFFQPNMKQDYKQSNIFSLICYTLLFVMSEQYLESQMMHTILTLFAAFILGCFPTRRGNILNFVFFTTSAGYVGHNMYDDSLPHWKTTIFIFPSH